THSDRRLVDAMTATLLQVFPDVHVMDVPNSFNSILVATSQPSQADTLAQNLAGLPESASPILREALALGVSSLAPTVPGSLIFSDDHAPVERLVDSLVQDFLLSGEAERFLPASSAHDT
ncbi:MAG: hypothetical protein OXB89_07755, partial [Anaerolineaceae bacterium]|nr:hypothetical protein [Anaerolineaceae bacterium]